MASSIVRSKPLEVVTHAIGGETASVCCCSLRLRTSPGGRQVCQIWSAIWPLWLQQQTSNMVHYREKKALRKIIELIMIVRGITTV